MRNYRLALQLFKLYNGTLMNDAWIDLNSQQNFNDRTDTVGIYDCSRLRVGKNCIVNRLSCITNKIKFDWLNLAYDSFKIKCKTTFFDY